MSSRDGNSTPAAPQPKPSYMDPAHVMDFAPLHLNHPAASKRTVSVVDLDVHVYGLDEIKDSRRPIAVILLSHGWANKAKDMDTMASGLLGEINSLAAQGHGQRERDVLVVTVDQRNHGERRRVRDGHALANHPRKLILMATSLTGGVQDHQLIMSFLPMWLWPNGEREVVEWMSTGFSMGGHIAWRLLREDNRVRIAVPIASIPSEHMVDILTGRGRTPDTWKLPTENFPPALAAWYLTPAPLWCFAGKKILTVHGGVDEVVPFRLGEQRFTEIAAAGNPGDVQCFIDKDRGHVCSPEMVRRAAEWFWRWGVRVQ